MDMLFKIGVVLTMVSIGFLISIPAATGIGDALNEDEWIFSVKGIAISLGLWGLFLILISLIIGYFR